MAYKDMRVVPTHYIDCLLDSRLDCACWTDLIDRLVFSLPTANITPKSQGGTVFVDAGTATCIGSPVIDFSGIAASTLLGEFVAVNGKKKRVFWGEAYMRVLLSSRGSKDLDD